MEEINGNSPLLPTCFAVLGGWVGRIRGKYLDFFPIANGGY